VPVVKGTIPHEVVGRQDAAKILMKPAAPGTGIIANGTVRAILELAGVQNVLTKAMGATNPVVLAQATVDGIKNMYSIERIASLRDITPAQSRSRCQKGGLTYEKLKITLVRSTIGYKYDQKDTVRRLGLKRMHQTVVKEDNPQIRGMIEKVKHLLTVEEVEE